MINRNRMYFWHAQLGGCCLAIGLGLGLFSSAAWTKEKDGHSYNGPDLAGTSVPVEVDRLVNRNDLKRANKNCLEEQARLLAEQALKSRVHAKPGTEDYGATDEMDEDPDHRYDS